MLDWLLTLAELRPWRCRACDRRFYAWRVAVRHAFYAHCPNCGNFDLQAIARARVEQGTFLRLKRLLAFPAYRCPSCRERFFSLRPYRQILPVSIPETPNDALDKVSSHVSHD
jgi:hypothetical protein